MLDAQNSQTTKQRIMDAAEDIAVKRGSTHITFDELVKQTGLSKGGILYHFPSKKILLKAMVQRMVLSFEHKRDRLASKVGPGEMSNAQTYILASFARPEKDTKSSSALMAAAANDPELLSAVREHYARNFQETRSTPNKSALANLLYLAVDGLWLLDSLQLCPLDKTERDDLKNLLLKLTEMN